MRAFTQSPDRRQTQLILSGELITSSHRGPKEDDHDYRYLAPLTMTTQITEIDVLSIEKINNIVDIAKEWDEENRDGGLQIQTDELENISSGIKLV